MCFTLRCNKQVKADTEKRDFLFSLPSVMPLAAQRTAKGKSMREEQRDSAPGTGAEVAGWDEAWLQGARDPKIKGISWCGPDNSPAGNTRNKQIKTQANKSSLWALRTHKSHPWFVPFGTRGISHRGEVSFIYISIFSFVWFIDWQKLTLMQFVVLTSASEDSSKSYEYLGEGWNAAHESFIALNLSVSPWTYRWSDPFQLRWYTYFGWEQAQLLCSCCFYLWPRGCIFQLVLLLFEKKPKMLHICKTESKAVFAI